MRGTRLASVLAGHRGHASRPLVSGRSRGATAGEMATESRMEQSGDVAGALLTPFGMSACAAPEGLELPVHEAVG